MTLVIMLGSSVISPVLPLLAQEFGVSYAGAGVLVSAFAVGRIPADFIGGALVDRVSPRLVASSGAALVALSAALSALAQSFPALLWYRLIGGVGSALVTSTAMARERAEFLDHLASILRGDARIVAAWIGGSIGRGEADDLSDIDIHLAVADEHCAQLNAERHAFVASFGEPILIQEAPQNAPTDGAFQLVLYRGISAPIEVDWSWRPASAAALPERAAVLFDRSAGLPRTPAWVTLSEQDAARQISLGTTFFWAMAFIAAKKIARRQPAAGTTTLAATEGGQFTGAVGTFTDLDPGGVSTDYNATIHWGDGTTTAGTVSGSAGGPFTV